MFFRFVVNPLGGVQAFTGERFQEHRGTWAGAAWLAAHLPLRLAFLAVAKPWVAIMEFRYGPDGLGKH